MPDSTEVIVGTTNGMDDPRVWEYRRALADVNKGLRAPEGAHDRYRRAIAPYVVFMAEFTPADSPIARKAMMSVLFESGLPLGVIAAAFKASKQELEHVKDHPPVAAPEPVDEQERLAHLPYGVYLRTSHWLSVRREALRRFGGRCVICNTTLDVEVHHRDYARRGAERPGDVVVLCGEHHSLYHDSLKAPGR